MRTPELKKTILQMTGKNEFYGYEAHKQLEQRNVKIGIGRLYSVLSEMKAEGLLKDRWEKSDSGPKRRVYKISKKGLKEREKILMEAIRTVHDFYTEYLINLPPKHSVFSLIGESLTKKLAVTSNVGIAASRFSGPIRRFIDQIRKKVSKGRLYVITEQANGLDLGIEDVLIVEGTFDDLPMKDGFLNLLVVSGNIKNDCLDDCLSEWRRVLSKDGVLAIVTPTATITTYEDPLDIGEFVEQREHPRVESDGSLSSEILKAKMNGFFKKIEERRIVHITLLLGKGTV